MSPESPPPVRLPSQNANSVPAFDRTSAGIRNVWYPSVPAVKSGLSVLCMLIASVFRDGS